MLHAFNDLIFIVDQDGVILEHKSGNPFQINDFPLNFLKRKLQDLLSADATIKSPPGFKNLERKNNAVQIEFFIPTPCRKEMVRIPACANLKSADHCPYPGYYKI